MKLCSFGPGTVNIFSKMVGLSEAQFSKDEENKKEEDDRSHYIVVAAFNTTQSKAPL
jgi:hypothetical protein